MREASAVAVPTKTHQPPIAKLLVAEDDVPLAHFPATGTADTKI